MKRKSDRTFIPRIVVSGTLVGMHSIKVVILSLCFYCISASNSSYTNTTPINLLNDSIKYPSIPSKYYYYTTNNSGADSLDNRNSVDHNLSLFNVSDSVTVNHSDKKNSFLSTGNDLWDGVIRDCYRKPTFACFQKNVFTYLDQTLDIADVNVTNNLRLTKNRVDFTKYTKEANDDSQEENEILEDEMRSESPLEEVTDSLYGKGVKFMMTHDIELKMPEIMFDGALFRISPRSIEGNGAIVKLELIPQYEVEARDSGRIFFIKKIKKIFKNKLLLSLLAILLVIKIIKIKLFWLLPLIVGVGTAKKLLLKFLLFLFPALSHIFKLCGYYHANYHQTKYHHHHHLINHHHTVVPPWAHDHDHHATSVQVPNGPELIFTQPPKGHPVEIVHGGGHGLSHDSPSWELSGPGLGAEYISDIHRNALVNGDNFKPKLDDSNDINEWGLGTTHTPANAHNYNYNPIYDPGRMTQQKVKPHGSIHYGHPKHAAPGASHIAAQYDPVVQQQMAIKQAQAQAQAQEAIRIQAEQKLIAQQQKILQKQPFIRDDSHPIMPKGYDPFYSPILAKIDKIMLQLGFEDDYCKERLVCSMYKSPERYSPHSNFISAELSRDTNELEKPSSTNASVIRFYRLVQAARDGQEQKDCLRLYPQCPIATE